jgi:hypothetical protein
VLGPIGSGKTTPSLQFLSGSSAAEPGLLLLCFQPSECLGLKAETMGLGLAGAESCGRVILPAPSETTSRNFAAHAPFMLRRTIFCAAVGEVN